MEPLRVEAIIKTQPAQLLRLCWVEVTVTNQYSEPVLINGRLAVGYRNSSNRELFAEVFRRGENEVVSKDARLYQRDLPQDADYVSLAPAQSISTTFDLCRWYRLPAPGDYELVVSYTSDESSQAGLLTGTYSSERVPFVVS